MRSLLWKKGVSDIKQRIILEKAINESHAVCLINISELVDKFKLVNPLSNPPLKQGLQAK